jgi:hypothetical protein
MQRTVHDACPLTIHHSPFTMLNEPHFIKLIFTLADTQAWLDELCHETYNSIPVLCKRKFRSSTYYLSVTALAHILERHYYKIPRHPDAGKFHITLIEILHYIKEAQPMPLTPVAGKATFQRTLQTNQHIGFDRNGLPATHITVITNASGNIITAFPGQPDCQNEKSLLSNNESQQNVGQTN